MDTEHIIHRVQSLPGVVNQCVTALLRQGLIMPLCFLTRPASSIIGLKVNSAGSASKTKCVQSGRRCLVEMHNRSVATLNAITYEGSGCSDKMSQRDFYLDFLIQT